MTSRDSQRSWVTEPCSVQPSLPWWGPLTTTVLPQMLCFTALTLSFSSNEIRVWTKLVSRSLLTPKSSASVYISTCSFVHIAFLYSANCERALNWGLGSPMAQILILNGQCGVLAI